MNHKLLFVATLSLATMAVNVGCKREASPEVAPAVETPPSSATVDAAPADHVMEPATVLNTKAFAGTFSGTLPCADCPGIDTTIKLRTDGTATVGEQHRERRHHLEQTGTWTVEADNTRVRFDPDSKAEQDRVFAIISKDQLIQLGTDGTPLASGQESSLTRDRAGP
ncbi:MAG: copper resistance protein NlpE [Luteimonas sp.]